MIELLAFISYLLWLYVYVLIAAVVFSWLVAFNVVNTRSPFVAAVGEFLYRVTDPLLRPIRTALPNLGGIDISPLVLMLIIMFITNVVIPVLARSVA
jgi:YggT family protein